MSVILGITPPTSSDISITLLIDGKIKCIVEEERLSRIKHDGGVWPLLSLEYVLSHYDLKIKDIDFVAIGELGPKYSGKDYNELIRKVKRYFGLYNLLKIFPEDTEIIFVEHHIAHAYSIAGLLDVKSAIMTLDGHGDDFSGLLGFWNPKTRELEILHKIPRKSSLGNFYELVTEFLGYRRHFDEGKVMGLSSYRINAVKPFYFFNLLEWPEFLPNKKDISNILGKKFGKVLWENKKLFNEKAAIIAASAQKELERVIIWLAKGLWEATNANVLGMAGGVTLNCRANMQILYFTNFSDVRVTPVTGDNGLSLGAALYTAINILGEKIKEKWPISPYKCVLKPYNKEVVENNLKKHNFEVIYESSGCVNEDMKFIGEEILGKEKEPICIFMGDAEAGPRALGHRSILSPADDVCYRDILNNAKQREPWRPLAPIVLSCPKAFELFDIIGLSSYWYMNVSVMAEKAKNIYPAIVHVDNTSRIQLVDKCIYQEMFELLKYYYKETGKICLINTSFNLKEPIVHTPEHAINTFKRLGLKYLYIGGVGVVRR